MKLNKIKYWIFELIEIKNHRYLLNLWTNYNLVVFLTRILLQQEHFMKLFYFRNWNIRFFSRDPNSSKYNGFISYLLFLFIFIIIIILFHIKNKIIIEKKNIYLINILPINSINYNFIQSINNNINNNLKNNLKESLLHYLENNEEEILLSIPIKKKHIYEFEFYRGSQWWRDWFVKKVTIIFLSCHLFQPKGILSEIFLSLRKKDKKDIEFIFCYYIDDLKYKKYKYYKYKEKYKEISFNFNLEQLLVILGNKSIYYIIYTFYKEALTINKDKNKSFGKLHKLYFKVLSNIKYDFARSILMRILISKQNGKYSKYSKFIDFIDIHNPFMNMNKDLKSINFIYNTNINKLNDKLIIFNTSFIQTENKLDPFNLKTSYLDNINNINILLEIEKRFFIKSLISLMELFVLNITRYSYSFLYFLYNIILDLYMGSKLLKNFDRNVESKEMGEIFKIILYFINLNNMNMKKKYIDLGTRSKFRINEQIMMSYTLYYNILNFEFECILFKLQKILEKILDIFTIKNIKLKYFNLINKEFQIEINKAISTVPLIKYTYTIKKKLSNFENSKNKDNNNLYNNYNNSFFDHKNSKILLFLHKYLNYFNYLFINISDINKIHIHIYRIYRFYKFKIHMHIKYKYIYIYIYLYLILYQIDLYKYNIVKNQLILNKSLLMYGKQDALQKSLQKYKYKYLYLYLYLIKKEEEESYVKSYIKKNLSFSIRLHDQYNWLEDSNSDIVSLKTYLFKINRSQFIKKKNNNYLWFYHKRLLLFKKIKPYTYINTYNFIYVNLLDSFILSSCKNIFSVSICLPIKSKLVDILIEIDKNLSTSSCIYKLNNLYKLYKYLHFTNIFTNISEPFLSKYIYLLEYFSATYLNLKEEQIFIFEKNKKNKIKSILDINRSHFERDTLYKYLIINLDSIMGLKYTYFLMNKLTLPLFEHFKHQKEQDRFISNKDILKRISYISRWDRLQAYMPCLLTLTNWTYIKLIILNSISDILLSSIQNIIYIFYDTTNKFDELIRNLQHIPINDTFNKILQNILLYKKYAKYINIVNINIFVVYTTSKISLKNTSKFLYLILIFIFTSGYIIFTQLLFFYQSYFELQKEFEDIKSLIIPSYMMGLKRIIYRYPYPIYNPFLEKFENSIFIPKILFRSNNIFFKNLIKIWMKIIPNPINRIRFLKNTIFLSKISKYFFSLIKKRNNIKEYWINDKIEIWVENSMNIFYEEERKFLVQFLTLKKEKYILNLLSGLDHEFISKNRLSFKINDQPGFISLHYLLDIHQIDINTYIFIFKKSILLEKHILLSHFHKITYSQIFCVFNRYNEKPFSLRLSLSYKGVLVIGSIGTGLSYFIQYLTKIPLVPLITIFISKFWGYKQKTTKLFYHFDNHVNSAKDTDDIYIKNINMLTMSTASNLDQLGLILQFELAKEISPCIIWIPNIHYLQMSELNYFYIGVGILDNYLFGDIERSSLGKILVIASTQIPKKVDPVLIDTNRFNICIKIRGLILSQQLKQFFIISYTKGFYFENKMFRSNKNKINTDSFTMIDLITIINEVLSLSITRNSYNIEMNTIISAYHIINWNYISKIISIKKNDILLYQIGRAFINNIFIRNFILDPISIYMKNKSYIRWNYSLYKWYLEFGTSIKKLTILFYIFSCSAGLIAKDLFYLYEDEGSNKIILYEFLDNEFYIVKGLLQLEGDVSIYLPNFFGIERELHNFYNNKITLFNRLKLIYWQEWFDVIKDKLFSIIYNQFIFIKKNYELEFDNNIYEGKFSNCNKFENDSVQNITWAPSIEQLCDNIYYFIKIGSEYLKYQLRIKYIFSEEYLKVLIVSQTNFPAYTSKRWFRNIKKLKNLDFLIYNQRFIIINRFLYISNALTLYESYQYLLNIFLSNRLLFYKLRKYLLINKWIFSDEIKNNINNI
uniref:Protein Ycf2 n=1 Tax=Gastrodia flexistyla TaxID=2974002 RepID=A0A976UF86_9ASPA|nr:hypothetical protein RF2 [Gastrodia flexistyla]UVG40864.1 hypothetical protein RF2 [Gastrodia flexistyla]